MTSSLPTSLSVSCATCGQTLASAQVATRKPIDLHLEAAVVPRLGSLTRRSALRGCIGVAGVAFVSPLLAACGGGAGQMPDASPVGSPAPSLPAMVEQVRFGWGTDVGVPTPFRVSPSGPAGAVLLSLLYDTLTWKDSTGIIPWLATSWEASADGTTYTFRITPDATWHDGRPLTADDIAFSFTYYAQYPYVWMTTEVVASSQATGGDAVRVTLRRPYAPFLEDIAGVVPIVPRHVWESIDDPKAYADAAGMIGSGPFSLAEYDQTAGAYRLRANDAYWRGSPRVREWRQLTIPVETSLQIAQRGEIDIVLSSDASVRDLLANDARLRVHATAPLSVVRLAVNTQRAPLDRKNVRQAIAYALDRVRLAETITRGPAIVGSAGVIPPETPWFNPSLPRYDLDPQRAKELLGGQAYTIGLIADANAREPELLQPMLAAVGITLNVQRVDAATRVQLLDAGDFDLALAQHIGVGGDPDFLRRWYAGEERNAFAKGSIFRNDEFAALAEQEAAALDPEARRELVFRMQALLAEELPTIVLYYRRFYWVYDPRVFTPMETWGGLMNGIPFPNNKLTLIGA